VLGSEVSLYSVACIRMIDRRKCLLDLRKREALVQSAPLLVLSLAIFKFELFYDAANSINSSL